MRKKIDEAVNIKDIIKSMQGNFGGDNESQMKGLQLMKGIATSDDPLANKFMKALDVATSKISKDILGKSESITIDKDIKIGDIILEKGDRIEIIESSSEFDNSFNVSIEDAKAISRNYGISWDKNSFAWSLTDMGEHVMSYVPKKGELYTDFSISEVNRMIVGN